MIAYLAEKKLAPFDDIWCKILDFLKIIDFRLLKFEVMSILKECALLEKISNIRKSLESISLL